MKARALASVIAELESSHAAARQFPANVQSLAAVKDVAETYQIYFGEKSETNLFWAAADVSSHHLSILVGKGEEGSTVHSRCLGGAAMLVTRMARRAVTGFVTSVRFEAALHKAKAKVECGTLTPYPQ